MYILSSEEMKAWDLFTIEQEPLSSIDLMERAAGKCVDWIVLRPWQTLPFHIFCGKGNNGGDGLAIARMLLQQGRSVKVYIVEAGSKGSPDFQGNLDRLASLTSAIHYISSEADFPTIEPGELIIDAIFGYGLNKPPEGLAAALIDHINAARGIRMAIDLPSGLFADWSSIGNKIVQAHHTLTFQAYKTALLIQENGPFIGQVHLLNIGLHPAFLESLSSRRYLVNDRISKAIFRPRDRFAHKGSFGHALLIAGSWGKMGAAVLSARALIRTGAGLLTCQIPGCGYSVMQTAVPEAMVITDPNEKNHTQLPAEIENYACVGIGPGIGTADATQKMLTSLTRRYPKPLVIDADGLNCLAIQKELIWELPQGTVLTPHPKEFDRLFGMHKNDFERMEKALQKARELRLTIVLKSHHSLVATAEGEAFFNSTGNAGMAKGGSGDVLTGIICSLLAQGYTSAHAAVLGVYLHGLAGDFAAAFRSKESMLPSDIIENLGEAFKAIIT